MIEQHVSGFVEHGSVSPNALLPFMVEDPDHRVAAAAAIDGASLFPVPEDDPMQAVRQVIGLIRSAKRAIRARSSAGCSTWGTAV
jgi:hypothetical protein